MKKLLVLSALCTIVSCIVCISCAEKVPDTLSYYAVNFLEKFNTDCIDQLCGMLFPAGYAGDTDYQCIPMGNEGTLYILHRYGDTERGTADLTATARIPGSCMLEYRVRHEEEEIQFDYNDKVLELNGIPYGCTMDQKEATKRASAIVNVLNSGMVCSSIGRMQGEIIGNSYNTIRSKEEAYYLVFSRQDPLVLPILSIDMGSYSAQWKSRKEEYFRITMTDEGIDSFVYTNPVSSLQEYGEKPIISAKEALKAAKQDISKNRKNSTKPKGTDELKLGYYLYYEKDDGYYYIPVWCCYDRKGDNPDEVTSIIRADTGKPISMSGE